MVTKNCSTQYINRLFVPPFYQLQSTYRLGIKSKKAGYFADMYFNIKPVPGCCGAIHTDMPNMTFGELAWAGEAERMYDLDKIMPKHKLRSEMDMRNYAYRAMCNGMIVAAKHQSKYCYLSEDGSRGEIDKIMDAMVDVERVFMSPTMSRGRTAVAVQTKYYYETETIVQEANFTSSHMDSHTCTSYCVDLGDWKKVINDHNYKPVAYKGTVDAKELSMNMEKVLAR